MRIFITLCTLLLITGNAYAGTYTPMLGKIENALYGFQYASETDNTRLSRIEKDIYGSSSSGNISERILRLKKDISADLIGQEISPREDTFAEESEKDYISSQQNIEYPAVDELENKVFNNTYKNKDIKERLTLLEEKTFGKSFNDDLSTRVDRLKAQIKPKSFMNNSIAQSSNDFYDGDIIPADKNYHLDRYDSPQTFDYDYYNKNNKPVRKINISTIENKILKRAYANDTMTNRLSRLESAMFGTEFYDDSEENRLNRIISAYQAQKSAAKYDSNKFTQNMATAMQIGMFVLMVVAMIL